MHEPGHARARTTDARTRLLAIVAAVVLGACTPTVYVKRIDVRQDPQGKVIEIIETEEIHQTEKDPAKIHFDHLRVQG